MWNEVDVDDASYDDDDVDDDGVKPSA